MNVHFNVNMSLIDELSIVGKSVVISLTNNIDRQLSVVNRTVNSHCIVELKPNVIVLCDFRYFY